MAVAAAVVVVDYVLALVISCLLSMLERTYFVLGSNDSCGVFLDFLGVDLFIATNKQS